jgi:parallel beta-helix repeat protein
VIQRNNIIIDGNGHLMQGSGGGDGLSLSSRSNVTIKNMRIQNFTQGIYLYSSSNIRIYANNISSNTATVHESSINAYKSNYVMISGNSFDNENNIFLYGSSYNNVSANNIRGTNTYSAYGIHLWGTDVPCSYNDIADNNVTNCLSGIWLDAVSSNNNITKNSITGCSSGISFYATSSNSISRNNIASNTDGFSIRESSNNNIYHNNLINNNNNVYTYNSVNVWDDGYPSGGNYWSDYTGQDMNGDGLGDTLVPHRGLDYYPLISPWPWNWTHNIVVTNVTSSTTEAYTGEIVQITVVVRNLGYASETFNVTTYYDNTKIDAKTVSSLSSGEETTLSFDWNTTNIAGGYYIILANASIVSGELYWIDNSRTDGTVKITSPVRIVAVTPCNQTGYPKDTFEQGTIAYFKVTINSTATIPQNTLITINLYDNNSITIGIVSFQGPILSGISTIIFGLPIPATATIGTATIYANCYTDWPSQGGFPHCPEMSATLEITGP